MQTIQDIVLGLAAAAMAAGIGLVIAFELPTVFRLPGADG